MTFTAFWFSLEPSTRMAMFAGLVVGVLVGIGQIKKAHRGW